MEVILSDCKKHPSCPHGPCLLFERYSSDGAKTGRKFFACSACRDRSNCNFFLWADEELSTERKTIWEKIKAEKSPPNTHEKYMKQLELFKSLSPKERKYCKTCALLIVDHLEDHSNHNIIENISSEDLVHPSSLFEIRENKKAEAQYFFSDTTINFIVTLLQNLGFSKLVSIGVPKIHEYVNSKQIEKMSSMLLDIDYRYMQFYNAEKFCHYNMFNNHFFGGKDSKKSFKNFLRETADEKIVIILDPPFGGLIDPISFTLKKINKWWQKENRKSDINVPIIWVFPYFHEGRILKNQPDMKMMDYKVEYVNHKKFGKSSSKDSPVRIFTNIDASSFVLPAKFGYRFCAICQRYISKENQHCLKCNVCTTKHGKTYHHCNLCNQCVKSSFVHCQTCNKCGLLSSKDNKMCKDCECSNLEDGHKQLDKCFNCHGIGHRKRNCPEGIMRHIKKRRIQKK